MATGQGMLGNNMFAYCRNNPISRKDASGTEDVSVEDFNEDNNPLNDVGNPTGRGGGGTSQAPKGSNSSHGSNSSQACFVAGTAVLTGTGNKNIEEIKAGDLVWAWDEETGDVALKEVVETYVNKTDELVHIFVDGEEIITTPSHPFYSPVKGWTEAARLRAGDILVLVNGEYVVVEKVQHEILEAPVTVYNFQVEDYHTYYVADIGVLVHNKCINDHRTSQTVDENIHFSNEGQARSFARTKVGHNPLDNGTGKLVSRDYRWQYRAKSVDVTNGHIHLERLNPMTGEVLTNYHIWWSWR